MKELSVFVDESGNYGGRSAKYYLITLVFHDQSASIVEPIENYEHALRTRGRPDIPLHMNPLMHGNESYKAMDTRMRSRLLAGFASFANKCPITYATFSYQRDRFTNDETMFARMRRDLVLFLFDTLQSFQEYDAVKIYYDDGQNEVTNVLHAAFGYVLGAQAVIYKECDPRHFRLQQIADYICEIELARIKYERSEQSKTEQIFFGSYRDFKKNHLRKIRTKRIR